MTTAWYLESTKAPGLRFKIVKLDKASRRATLLGDTGVPFDREISDETLQKYGYRVVRAEETGSVSGTPPPA